MQRLGLASGSLHVGFVVGKVALGHVFLQVPWFPCHCHSAMARVMWGMNSRPVDDCSSETLSQPIDVKNITNITVQYLVCLEISSLWRTCCHSWLCDQGGIHNRARKKIFSVSQD
jgi:hypothetical protein